MATRPIFKPLPGVFPYVAAIDVEFEWHPGFSKAQAQRSIAALHTAAARRTIEPVLEISSKSPTPLGVRLSAFNLELHSAKHVMTVECAFQGSKVFVGGGPYQELYFVSSRDAKGDPRLANSGELVAFRFFERNISSTPVTAFYDWLYLTALVQNRELALELPNYQGFSDIAFNPIRSWNCQARSAALFVALSQMVEVERLVDIDEFLITINSKRHLGFEPPQPDR